MSEQKPKKIVEEIRAAALLGFTREQLRELSEASGLGHVRLDEHSDERAFTYEELYRLCRLAICPVA